MSAFQDAGHHWWQICSMCGMAWSIGGPPGAKEADEDDDDQGQDVVEDPEDHDDTCARCAAPSVSVLQQTAGVLYAQLAGTPCGKTAPETRLVDLRVLERAASGTTTAADHRWPKGFQRGETPCLNPGCPWTREVIRVGPRAGIYFRKPGGRRTSGTPGACTGQVSTPDLPPAPPRGWPTFLVEVAFAPRCGVEELSDSQVTEMVARFLPTAPDSDFSARLLVGKRKPSE